MYGNVSVVIVGSKLFHDDCLSITKHKNKTVFFSPRLQNYGLSCFIKGDRGWVFEMLVWFENVIINYFCYPSENNFLFGMDDIHFPCGKTQPQLRKTIRRPGMITIPLGPVVQSFIKLILDRWKPWLLTFNRGLALIGFRTTGPWRVPDVVNRHLCSFFVPKATPTILLLSPEDGENKRVEI